MNFSDKIRATGHLQIIKKDSVTGKEEVLFEDHNVITGGLGRSIAQFMAIASCEDIERCEPVAEDKPINEPPTAGYATGGSTISPRIPVEEKSIQTKRPVLGVDYFVED
jgi:hypothetical protein